MPFRSIRTYMTAAIAAVALTSAAAPIDEAKRLYNEGAYAAAIETLEPIVKRSPRDGTANYYLGASYMALGNFDSAIAPLKVAETRGVGDASRLLAEAALADYRTDNASAHLGVWEKNLKKGRKAIPQEHADMSARIIRMRNMLDRVERIEIIDSISVDTTEFFKAYRLSEAAGRILAPETLRRSGAGTPGSSLSTAYMPQTNTEILWAETDTAGVYVLCGADILDDGTVDRSAPLDPTLGENGDAKFPFLMPDGVTLYFANNGENSIGGYDIFMTRRNEDGSYYQPQNIGMPYNSPANDYMLAIDEYSGLGWWATDRSAEPGKVTIFVFKPSPMRVNVEPDDENLLSYAALDNISLTRKEGVDYKAMLSERMPVGDNGDATQNSARFNIDMGNGKVYTRLSDFRNDNARAAMLEVLGAEAQLRRQLETEDAMRESYRKGDRSLSARILESESTTARMRSQLEKLRNKTVRLETAR